MKKRILSFLLLVAMVVTALPLVAFPVAAAANAPEFTEDDYNDLYVKKGLDFAADFFAMNPYWNTDGKTFAVPAGPSEMTAYKHKDGYTYNFTIEGERYEYVLDKTVEKTTTEGTTVYQSLSQAMAAAEEMAEEGVTYTPRAVDINDAFLAAANQWYKDEADFYSQFVWAGPANADFHSYQFALTASTAKARMENSAKVFTVAILKDGYVTMRPDYNTNGGFYPKGMTAANTLSSQFVVTFPANYPTSDVVPFIHFNTRLYMKRTGDAVDFTSYVSSSTFAPNVTVTPKASVTVDKITTLTSSFVLSSTENDVHRIYLDGVKAVETEGQFGAAADTALSGSNIIAWGRVQEMSLYAVRNYTDELTEAEIAQNHFADIVKWFKLDITPITLLTPTDMQSLYTSFAAFTFDSDRAAVAETLLTTATTLVQAKYSSVNSAWVALAVQYGLDISPLLTMPKGMLVNTVAFLNGGYKTSTDVKADFAAAFAADIAALRSDMTPAEYNALYAQEGLVIAIDYLSASEHWNTEALAPNAEQYVWRWEHPKKAAHKITATTGTVGNGVLTLPVSFNMGETSFCNDLSLNGSTTEYTFHDATAGAGTYLNIDDIRISASLSGDTVAITRLAMRNEDGTFRYPAGEGEWAKVFNKDGFYTFTPGAAATTAVLSMVRPAYTEEYYGFATYVTSDKIVLPTASQLKKEETGDAAADLLTVQTALSMLNSNGTLKTASQYGTSFFYVTHDLVDGELVARADVTVDSGANQSKYLSAFYKPVYHVADDGKVYIIGATYRPNNNGAGHGLGNDFLNGSAESDFYTSTPGSLSLTLNGATVFARDDVYFLSNNLTGGTFLRYNYKAGGAEVARDMYAYRSYKRVLSADELAQNHFVDIAKFFRLNLTGLDTLAAAGNTEALNAVYASVADLNVATATRTEAQLAVTAALNVYVDEVYEDMKAEYPALAAFIDVARDYRLDIADVLAAKRDMSSVYATSFEGLSCAEAQLLLDEAYLDAYYYLSYGVADTADRAAEWNAMLKDFASGTDRVELEPLMVLPYAERLGVIDAIADADDVQAAVDAYVAAAMEKYAATDTDYNALYVKDGLYFAFDMMQFSSYWGVPMPSLPAEPATLTAYFYDANGNGERDEGEVHDFTKKENRLGGYNYALTKDGGKTLTYPENTKSFATEAEARAAAQATLAKSSYAAYELHSIVPEISPAFRAATNDFYAAERAYLEAYTWCVDKSIRNYTYLGSYKPHESGSVPKHIDTLEQVILTYTLGDGCLVMRGDYSTDGGLQAFNGATSAVNATDMSLQLVTKLGTTPTKKLESVLFHNARPRFAYNATKTEAWFAGVGGTSSFKGTLPETVHFSTTEVQDLTFTLSGLLTENTTADCDTLTIATQDGVLGTAEGVYTNSGNELTVNGTNYIGYSAAAEGNEIYAIRYYSKSLSLAEIRQNHFADLAKYYKLDVTGYLGLDDALRAEAHEALAAYTIGEATKVELADALAAVVEQQYEGTVIDPANAALNEAFTALAAFASLDLAPIENLNVADRVAIAEVLLATFDTDYAIHAAVVQFHYAALTADLSLLTFAGYQVRLTTGTELADYAGVRAVFDVDTDAIAALCADGKTVTLTVGVTVDGDEKATLCFVYAMADGSLSVTGTSTSASGTEEAVTYVRPAGDKMQTSFNYTVTFKGEDYTAEKMTAEFGYTYTIAVEDGVSDASEYGFLVDSRTFGTTVNARDLYAYFAENGYADDRVVSDVVEKFPAAPAVDTEVSAEEWESAFQLGENYTLTAAALNTPAQAVMLYSQMRDGNAIHYAEMYCSLSGELLNTPLSRYSTIKDGALYDYVLDEESGAYRLVESEATVEQLLTLVMDEYVLPSMREYANYTYDAATGCYYDDSIAVEYEEYVWTAIDMTVRFEDGKLVSFTYAMSAQFDVPVSITLTYGDAVVTLPTIE